MANPSINLLISSVQFGRSLVSDSLQPMNHSKPGLPVHHQLPEFIQTHGHRVSDATHHLILCHYLLLLHSILPSIRVFSNESAVHIRWPKYWSFSFSIIPSNEHPGADHLQDGLVGSPRSQGTLKSLLQHHSSKTSILRSSAFFIVQLSHPYMTTGKTIALTRPRYLLPEKSVCRSGSNS